MEGGGFTVLIELLLLVVFAVGVLPGTRKLRVLGGNRAGDQGFGRRGRARHRLSSEGTGRGCGGEANSHCKVTFFASPYIVSTGCFTTARNS